MREIKFRGKSKLGMKPWIYGFLLIDEMGNKFISFKPDDDNFQLCPIEDDSDGQYTGLKDKNGKEIYEGDIIKLDDVITSITWEDGGFQMVTSRNQGKSSATQDRLKRFEVIGNIYENPELLNND